MRSKWLVGSVCFAALAGSPNLGTDANAGPSKPSDQAAPSVRHPTSGLQVIDLAVLSGQMRHNFRVELADTREAQARGLMFRTQLGDDEGMLVPSETPDVRSFWMKNTPLSLDIIFVNAQKEIVTIHTNTPPMSEQNFDSSSNAMYAIEVNAGYCLKYDIREGLKVDF